MTLTVDKVHAGMDLTDLLLRNIDETAGYHSNHPWTISTDHTLSSEVSAADDFLEALLGGSESSSAATSPLWSPCTTDSSINDDPPTDPTEGLQPPSCVVFPASDPAPFPQLPPQENQPPSNDIKPHVSIDLGWESGDLKEEFGITHYLTLNHKSSLLTAQTLTVKDLLLSNLGQKAQQSTHNSLQELVLNEDEKRLLAKEGMNLPSKLPLSKVEERVLKKIRRKIRNKHSAQESRKKKREYVDSLEGRMSACNACNLELQRKIQKLEETNNVLLEQLSQLQALLPNSSSKTTHRGTCILVLLLSFSLIISTNLQPEPSTQLSQGEYALTRVPSRSLQSVDGAQNVPLLPDKDTLTPERDSPSVRLLSTHIQDDRR